MTKEVKDYIINQLQNFNIDSDIVAFKDVNYIAVNSDGWVYGYKQKPRTTNYRWSNSYKDTLITFIHIKVPENLIRNFAKEIISMKQLKRLAKFKETNELIQSTMTENVKNYIIDTFIRDNVKIDPDCKFIAVDQNGCIKWFPEKPGFDTRLKCWATYFKDFRCGLFLDKTTDLSLCVPENLIKDFTKEIISVEDFNKLLKQKKEEKDNNMIASGKVSNGIITSPIFENKDDIKNDDNPYVLNQLESLRPIFIEKQQINPYFSHNFNEIYHTDNFYYKSRTERHQTENIIFSFEYNDIANDPKVITIPLSRQEYERWCNNGLMLDSWLFDAHDIRSVYHLKKYDKNKGKEE